MSHRVRWMVALLLTLSACNAVPEELRPPQVLRDSLGLGDGDAVFEVGIRVVDGEEVATPDTLVMVRPGWISFRSDDPRARRVVPDTAGLEPDLRAWIGERVSGSPPLIHRDSRWVLDGRTAPAGEVVFRVIGSAREGTITVRFPAPDAAR